MTNLITIPLFTCTDLPQEVIDELEEDDIFVSSGSQDIILKMDWNNWEWPAFQSWLVIQFGPDFKYSHIAFKCS